ncbi:hypothetical protein OQA88_11412 [Cercophora sp. LCS_1]
MDSDKNLSHDEIWDDSALVNSWNEALDEYNKYHSVFANGGTVDDIPVIKKENPQQSAKPETEPTGEPIESEDAADQLNSIETRANIPLPQQLNGSAANHHQGVGEAAAPAIGPQLLAGIQDDDLKRLLMSWYYAGYYTGLFEGKQSQTKGGTSK